MLTRILRTLRPRAVPRPRSSVGPVEQLESRDVPAACGCSGPLLAPPDDSLSVRPRIVNGDITGHYPSVGLVGDQSGYFCSGTLIAPRYVLTAGHCAVDLGAFDGRVRIGGATYTTEDVFVHPRYRSFALGTDRANDIAILQLSRPVQNVKPTPIFRGTPRVGQFLRLVGFGAGGSAVGGENGDFGIKRTGITPIDAVSRRLIRWNFDHAAESNTAPGDSGGPAFLRVHDRLRVAGITSGGSRPNAGLGDHSFDTRVDAYKRWIDSVVGNPSLSSADDHGDDPESATVVGLSAAGAGSTQGRIEESDDRDVFRFVARQTGTMTLWLRGADDCDPFLRVLDDDSHLLALNGDTDGLDSRVRVSVARGETYHVEASGYDSTTGSYQLSLSTRVPRTHPASAWADLVDRVMKEWDRRVV